MKVIALLALIFLGCTDFPSRFERLDGDKIRPLAIICDPAEVMPGDTVYVKLIADFPKGIPDIKWTVALDYKQDAAANDVYERNVREIETMPGYAVDSSDSGLTFRFLVPESVLIQSTALNEIWRNFSPVIAPVLGSDSLYLALNALETIPPSLADTQVVAFANLLGCRIKLRAHMEQGIILDVTKLLTVRYTKRFAFENKNPLTPTKMNVIQVRKRNLSLIDSVNNYKRTIYVLTGAGDARLFPQRKIFSDPLVDTIYSDTVIIDTGCSYFVQVDSVDVPDVVPYIFTDENRNIFVKADTEFIYYNWFVQHLDETTEMKRDSLILFNGRGTGRAMSFLPPVDTALHDYRFHVVAADYRVTDPHASVGASYFYAKGHFRYTDAYAAKTGKRGLF